MKAYLESHKANLKLVGRDSSNETETGWSSPNNNHNINNIVQMPDIIGRYRKKGSPMDQYKLLGRQATIEETEMEHQGTG